MSSTGRETLSLVRASVLMWSTSGSFSSFSGMIRLSRWLLAFEVRMKEPSRVLRLFECPCPLSYEI